MLSDDILHSYHICDWAYGEEAAPISFHHFEKWIKNGYEVPLSYLSDHRFDRRKSLKHIYKDFQSYLVFLFDYSKEREKFQHFYRSKKSNGLKIASYALGFQGYDYHVVIKDHLLSLGRLLQKQYKGIEFIYSLDVHPVLEKDLAYRAGLGWFGKNSLLLHKKYGSFFLIGALLFNKKLPFPKRTLERDHCGQCTRCIDACPTKAIDPEMRRIVTNKCISTFTIELFKRDVPSPLGMEMSNGEIFGCDICQDVCPWNQRPLKKLVLEDNTEHHSKKFEKTSLIVNFFLTKKPLEVFEKLRNMTKRGFRKLFKETPYERTGRDGLLKNVGFWLK